MNIICRLVKHAPVAMILLRGSSFVVELANNNALELFGKKYENTINVPALNAFPELKEQGFDKILEDVYSKRVTFVSEETPVTVIRNGKPETRYITFTFEPLKTDDEQIKQGSATEILLVGTDVTDSVRKRLKIQKNEEQLRIVLEGGDLGYFDLYLQTGELIWSGRAKEFFGLEEDVIPHPEIFLAAVHPEDRERTNATVQQAFAGANGGVYENVYRVIGIKNGKLRWLRSKGKVTFDEQGRAERFTGIIHDITNEKLAEEKILQSEQRFRSTFENAAVGIAHVDLDGTWLMVNDRLCEIVGYSREELLNATFQDITYPDDLEADLHLMYQLLDSKISTYSMEKRYIRKEGSIVWINLTVALARNSEGAPHYFISIVQDISDRKRAEEALKQSEEQFRKLANSIQNLAWMADSEGWVFWYNQRWYEYTGTTLEEMQGWGWQKVHHSDHVDRVVAYITNAWIKGQPFELTFPLRKYDGEYRWFLARAYPVKNTDGKVERWIGTNTDIDEQKAAEETLEKLIALRTNELERSNDDLQQFAHVVSHDLKEPVRKIQIFGNILNKKFSNALGDEGLMYLEKIEKAARRIGEMIDGVLLYSSINATQQINDKINLIEIFNQIISDLELLIKEKNAVISFEALPEITGSPILIYQLFYNLINNSLKFSKKDEKTKIFISCTQQGNQSGNREYVKIKVQDNGIGFDQSEATKIFQTFSRLNSKDNYEGTGLGLALCKKIAERHGGAITAQGEEGIGATFIITLPAM